MDNYDIYDDELQYKRRTDSHHDHHHHHHHQDHHSLYRPTQLVDYAVEDGRISYPVESIRTSLPPLDSSMIGYDPRLSIAEDVESNYSRAVSTSNYRRLLSSPSSPRPLSRHPLPSHSSESFRPSRVDTLDAREKFRQKFGDRLGGYVDDDGVLAPISTEIRLADDRYIDDRSSVILDRRLVEQRNRNRLLVDSFDHQPSIRGQYFDALDTVSAQALLETSDSMLARKRLVEELHRPLHHQEQSLAVNYHRGQQFSLTNDKVYDDYEEEEEIRRRRRRRREEEEVADEEGDAETEETESHRRYDRRPHLLKSPDNLDRDHSSLRLAVEWDERASIKHDYSLLANRLLLGERLRERSRESSLERILLRKSLRRTRSRSARRSRSHSRELIRQRSRESNVIRIRSRSPRRSRSHSRDLIRRRSRESNVVIANRSKSPRRSRSRSRNLTRRRSRESTVIIREEIPTSRIGSRERSLDRLRAKSPERSIDRKNFRCIDHRTSSQRVRRESDRPAESVSRDFRSNKHPVASSSRRSLDPSIRKRHNSPSPSDRRADRATVFDRLGHDFKEPDKLRDDVRSSKGEDRSKARSKLSRTESREDPPRNLSRSNDSRSSKNMKENTISYLRHLVRKKEPITLDVLKNLNSSRDLIQSEEDAKATKELISKLAEILYKYQLGLITAEEKNMMVSKGIINL